MINAVYIIEKDGNIVMKESFNSNGSFIHSEKLKEYMDKEGILYENADSNFDCGYSLTENRLSAIIIDDNPRCDTMVYLPKTLTSSQAHAFGRLKEKLSTHTVMYYYNDGKNFEGFYIPYGEETLLDELYEKIENIREDSTNGFKLYRVYFRK